MPDGPKKEIKGQLGLNGNIGLSQTKLPFYFLFGLSGIYLKRVMTSLDVY